MSTARIISQGVAAGVRRRPLACALLLLPAILYPTGRSDGEEVPSAPTARIATDSAADGLQVELFRAPRQSKPSTAVAHPQSQAAIRLPLLAIVGSVPADMSSRTDAVHALGRCLNREEATVLCEFVKSPPGPEEKDLPGLETLKNDILNVVRGQSPPPSALTESLIAVYRDPIQDAVIRDYAIQHLVGWYEQGAPDAPAAPERIRSVLFEAAAGSGTIAGTALLSLHLLSAEDPALEQSRINHLALRLVSSGETEVASRITAMQVCAERGLKEALPAIQSVMEAQSCVPLRLSALAALARLGGGQQASVLGPLGAEDRHAAPAGLREALPQRKHSSAAF